MNSVFRTDENQASYDAYRAAGNLDRGCVLCARESVHEFKNWRIIENIFPYDKIAKLHHMVIPKKLTNCRTLKVSIFMRTTIL
jgi:hypothetical protein